MPNFLQPHGLQHSSLLSSTISPNLLSFMSIKSVVLSSHLILCHPLLLLPLVFPNIRASCGQSIGASALVLPVNVQGWFPLGLTSLISLQSNRLSRVFYNTTFQKHPFGLSALFMVQLSHPYMTTGKTIALTIWIIVGKVMALLFFFFFNFLF